jgi:hypothetical protein
MASQMDSRYSRQHAARCLQLAEATPSAKLKSVLLAEAEAWTSLAADQEWLEQRAIAREKHDALSASASNAAEAGVFRRVA